MALDASTASRAVRVAVRVRPIGGAGGSSASSLKAKAKPSAPSASRTAALARLTTQGTTAQLRGRTYAFDDVFDSQENGSCSSSSSSSSGSQEAIYTGLGEPMVRSALNGYNGCILAYGQTGAGKSYSMFGDPWSETERGLLPRACASLFAELEARRVAAAARGAGETSSTTTIVASYVEIYNEKIRDLLVATPASPAAASGSGVGDLQVRAHAAHGQVIVGLTEAPVADCQAVLDLWTKGEARRAIAGTMMNAASSRSHAIFTLELRTSAAAPGAAGGAGIASSPSARRRGLMMMASEEQRVKMHFVDLAGSEKQWRAGTKGERLSEGIAINQSLTTLSRVIYALTSGDPNFLPPFRESKLTLLLREASENVEETLGTFEFASRCKLMRTQARQHELPRPAKDLDPQKLLSQLEEERALVASLRVELSEARQQHQQLLQQQQQRRRPRSRVAAAAPAQVVQTPATPQCKEAADQDVSDAASTQADAASSIADAASSADAASDTAPEAPAPSDVAAHVAEASNAESTTVLFEEKAAADLANATAAAEAAEAEAAELRSELQAEQRRQEVLVSERDGLANALAAARAELAAERAAAEAARSADLEAAKRERLVTSSRVPTLDVQTQTQVEEQPQGCRLLLCVPRLVRALDDWRRCPRRQQGPLAEDDESPAPQEEGHIGGGPGSGRSWLPLA
eukprot:TRINITY_DN8245_c0_g2_i1.p1 TRINITY_DN8245_c0_g2~~TRINITY_DN8245_c0_g2_i1.p1  ORF type:complete len:691 (+),score=194.00 TRINITY_DN8245_c0_g2_i1:87-2159(+)